MSNEVYEGLGRRTGGALSLAVLGGAGTGKTTLIRAMESCFGAGEGSGQAQAEGLALRFSENGTGNAAVLLASDGTANGARSDTVAQEESLAARLHAEGIPFVETALEIADEAEAFAEKITTLYQDNDRLGAMCRRSQEYIREYFSLDGAWKNIEEDFS